MPQIDLQIQRAIADHIAWDRRASPSKDTHEPRVIVQSPHTGEKVARRPFYRRGHWSVRWTGIARLTDPQEVNGIIVFTADWSRP
jgi:hypothetical protein